VAVVDLGLPGMSGHEVARQLRAPVGGKRPLLIAVTGWGREKDRQRSAQAGVDLHLLEPVDPDYLEKLQLLLEDQNIGTALYVDPKNRAVRLEEWPGADPARVEAALAARDG
jgi:CheY-like chemotaxis protein